MTPRSFLTWTLATAALCMVGPSLLMACAPDQPLGRAVVVDRLLLDPDIGAPVVLLREAEGARRTLPIWIGPSEARSIEARLEQRSPIRPNTHDLAKRLLDRSGARVHGILVTDLVDGVYYASIRLVTDGGEVDVDARPSDAIALALRFDAPIFVDELLFARARDAARNRQVPSLRL